MPFIRNSDGSLSRRKLTPKDVLDVISKNGINFVDLQFSDVPGRMQHVTIPASMMNEKTFTEGVSKLDGSSIRGFTDIHESDMILVPDPTTFGVIPWSSENLKYCRLISNVHWGFGKVIPSFGIGSASTTNTNAF